MSNKTAITSNKLSPPVGPFSPALRDGEYIFFSGQVGQDPSTGRLVSGGVEPETEQIFANLTLLLAAADKTFSDVVRVGVFLTDISSFSTMNGIYAKYFAQPYPARTTVGVAALPLGASVEVDIIVRA